MFANETFENLPFEDQCLTDSFHDIVEASGFCRLARTNSPVFLHDAIIGNPKIDPVRMQFTCQYFEVKNLFDIQNAFIGPITKMPYDALKEWTGRYIVLYAVRKTEDRFRIFFVNNDQLQ